MTGGISSHQQTLIVSLPDGEIVALKRLFKRSNAVTMGGLALLALNRVLDILSQSHIKEKPTCYMKRPVRQRPCHGL